MEGVIQGAYYCNQDRTSTLSKRMFDRNLPSVPLQMNYDPRPANTRYVLFPMLDCRRPATVPRERRPIYNPKLMFSPGDSLPFSGYQNGVNTESALKEIIFPLQACAQAKYIPSTGSDLFDNSYLVKGAPRVRMTNPLLFEQQKFAPFNPNTCDTGKKRFNNFTRYQIRGLPDSSPPDQPQ
jgi:hypothetical protein